MATTATTRQERLALLRERLHQASLDNRRAVLTESNTIPMTPYQEQRQGKKRAVTERIARRLDAQETGTDPDRVEFWDYSIEDVERYEEKKRVKRERKAVAEAGFTDFEQMAERVYAREIKEVMPSEEDVEKYIEWKEKNSGGEVAVESVWLDSDMATPSDAALQRLSNDITAKQRRRARGARKHGERVEGEEVNFINDKNAHFNRKIERVFGKVTKEVKESLERGTAL